MYAHCYKRENDVKMPFLLRGPALFIFLLLLPFFKFYKSKDSSDGIERQGKTSYYILCNLSVAIVLLRIKPSE